MNTDSACMDNVNFIKNNSIIVNAKKYMNLIKDIHNNIMIA